MTVYGIDRAAFNQGANAKYDFIISDDISMTLVSRGPNAVGIIYDISEDSRSLVRRRLQGAEQTVCTSGQISPRRERENVAEAEFWDGTQTCSTLTANNAQGGQRMPDKENFNCIVENPVTESIVRRLTPLECERLQGFPDGWTDIGPWTDSKGKLHKECSDSSRYKALGNSIATGPNSFWKFLIKRICAQYDREVTMGSLFDGIGGFPLVHEQINGKGSCRWASEIEEFCIAVTKYHFGED